MSTKVFSNKFCFRIWSNEYIELSVTLLFIFVLYFLWSWLLNVLSHILQLCQFLSKKYKIFYISVKEPEIMSLPMVIENSFWYARIGIFNLSRVYSKKMQVPRFPLTNYYFNVLFFLFLSFIIKLFFCLKLQKLLFLLHYILIMYSFNLYQLLLLQSGYMQVTIQI